MAGFGPELRQAAERGKRRGSSPCAPTPTHWLATLWSGVAVDQLEGEGWEADRDVVGALGVRGAVLDPFAGADDDGLAGLDVEGAGGVRDADDQAVRSSVGRDKY